MPFRLSTPQGGTKSRHQPLWFALPLVFLLLSGCHITVPKTQRIIQIDARVKANPDGTYEVQKHCR